MLRNKYADFCTFFSQIRPSIIKLTADLLWNSSSTCELHIYFLHHFPVIHYLTRTLGSKNNHTLLTFISIQLVLCCCIKNCLLLNWIAVCCCSIRHRWTISLFCSSLALHYSTSSLQYPGGRYALLEKYRAYMAYIPSWWYLNFFYFWYFASTRLHSYPIWNS